MRPASVFNEQFLLDELFVAATQMSPMGYAEFQLRRLWPGKSDEFGLRVSLGEFSEDAAKPEILGKAGAGGADQLTLTYGIPFRKDRILEFSYRLPSEARGYDAEIGYLHCPFFLGWLHQQKIICAETLLDWLQLCEGLTLPRFQMLQLMVAGGLTRAQDLSAAMGKSVGTIYRHTENAFEKLLITGFVVSNDGGNAARIPALIRQFAFLGFTDCKIKREFPHCSTDAQIYHW
jgi:hypothetical protein